MSGQIMRSRDEDQPPAQSSGLQPLAVAAIDAIATALKWSRRCRA